MTRIKDVCNRNCLQKASGQSNCIFYKIVDFWNLFSEIMKFISEALGS